ncbi:MAG TPA: PH domain-containing protein [Thermoplasmata archaeon]|nr:PH domain-containing protein [Thermoplasmata archaeon]
MATTPPVRSMPKLLKATYLADQEYLLDETRATKLFYFPGPFFFTLIFGVLALITKGSSIGFNTDQWPGILSNVPSNLQAYVGDLFTLLFLIGLLWLLIRYFRWRSTVYAVTNRRVIVQHGIFSRDFDEIPVTQVRGVDVHMSFGQRILRYGTIRVSSEGGSRVGNEDWLGIPKPFKFQKIIENAQQGAYQPVVPAGTVPPPH